MVELDPGPLLDIRQNQLGEVGIGAAEANWNSTFKGFATANLSLSGVAKMTTAGVIPAALGYSFKVLL